MDFTHYPLNPVYTDTPTYYTGKGYGAYEYRTDVLSAEDWLGHRFAVGEKVMYCIGAGHGQMMAIGEVKQIRTRIDVRGYWDYGTPRDYQNKKFVKTGEETLIEVLALLKRQAGIGTTRNDPRLPGLTP